MTRTLITGAQIISMASGRPPVERSDLLVRDDIIEAIEPEIASPEIDAEVVDARGRILIPGLVNAHLHTWQTGLRSIGADWTLMEYLVKLRFSGASEFTADDVRIGTLAGAWNQINLGTTTLGDWSHNCTTPEHADAALEALASAGIRSLFMHGMPMWPGDRPHPEAEFERLTSHPTLTSPLIEIGLAVNGLQYSIADVAVADFELAAKHNCVISMHLSGGRPADESTWSAVHDAGLIDRRTNIVHGVGITHAELARLVECGVSFSLTPENELSQGHGVPIIRRLLDAGTSPSLGTDVECVTPGAVLDAARFALAVVRGLDNERDLATASRPDTTGVSSYEALNWATIQGAKALAMDDRIGSLEPRKQADLVLIDSTALNLWPPHDPIATAVQASLANIESVMIAGEWRKRDHRLVGVDTDRLRHDLLESSERLVPAIGLTSHATASK